jgi:predicted permease
MGDLRYAMRTLAKSPGFTFAVVGLLALGIGANTAIFTALDALLLRPLPVRQPQQLIRLVQVVPRLGTISSFRHEVYDSLQHASTLSAVIGDAEWPVAMDDPKPAEQVRVQVVTHEFFEVLGVPALYGRTLTANDAREDPGPPPVVLSYGFWQRRLAGDALALGRKITLRGHKFVVVGVMPRSFNGITTDTAPDLRIPVRAFPLLRFEGAGRYNGIALELTARLKPGVTLAQARAECFAIWRAATEDAMRRDHAKQADIDSEIERGLQIESLEQGASVLRDRFGLAVELLSAAAGLLLLLMCSNVAGLLLARNSARREEIAVRLALGASRARLGRQMLAESALLALAGASVGWLIAAVSLPILAGALPPMRDRATTQLALSLDLAPNGRVLLFAIAVTIASSLLCGLASVLSSSHMNLDSVLRGVRSSRGGGRHRNALVVLQVALCTLLLAGAGLLVRSFRQLRGMNPGFDAAHVVTFTAYPSLSGYTLQQCERLRLALLDRVRALPTVISAATASRAVMRGSGLKMTLRPEGQPIVPSDFLNTSENTVSPEYFETMGMRIVEGQGFRAAGAAAKPARAIVNQAFVRQFFLGADPIGRRLWNGFGSTWVIVGVVNDAKYRSLREPMTPILYNLGSDDVFVLCIRTRTPPDSIVQAVRRELAAIDPALPFIEIHTLAEEVDASAASERLTAALASLFGLLAALLAAFGIYGLLAYAVAQRRREIGIRMAIGARPGDIARMVSHQSLALVVLGVAAGLGAAWETAPAIQSLLYEVAPTDGVSLAAAAMFVLLVSALATAIPAVRATRVEPASALRD